MSNSQNTMAKKLLEVMPLLLIVALCVVVLHFVNLYTRDTIAENRQRAAMAILDEVLPVDYDNDLFTSSTRLSVPKTINRNGALDVYFAQKENQTVAYALMPVTAKGYGGSIELLIGISHDGRLLGVHILDHNETEGFGDQAHQDKSDWLSQFSGLQADTYKENQWAVKQQGGTFD